MKNSIIKKTTQLAIGAAVLGVALCLPISANAMPTLSCVDSTGNSVTPGSCAKTCVTGLSSTSTKLQIEKAGACLHTCDASQVCTITE